MNSIRFLLEKDTWQEVYDSLSKNKLRTLLTMIGVWWGILMLISLLGASRGLENSFNRLFGDFATNSVFIWARKTSKPFLGFQKGKPIKLSLDDINKIKENVDGVRLALPRNSKSALVKQGFQSGNYSIFGDYPIYDLAKKRKIVKGRFINALDIESNKKVVVISNYIYKQLFLDKATPIGRYLTIDDINYKIVGLFETDDPERGPSSDIHIPFTTFQQVYNQKNKIGYMMITGFKDFDIKKIENDVIILLRNLKKVHPKDNRAFGSFNLGAIFEKFTGFLTGMQFLTWIVGIATLIAGVFAIGNILLITVKERTKEIGVRRALGATPFEIKRQIIIEAIFITLLSGLLGIISGGLILMLLDYVIGQGEDAILVNASVSLSVVFLALIILVILGSLIGLIPAFKATQVRPIEALREE